MKSLSFKVQIALFVILLIAAIVYSYYWTVSNAEKQVIMSEVMQKVVLQARNIALSSAKPLLHEDPEFELHPLIMRILKTQKDIVSVVITDREGRIKGHRTLQLIDKLYIPKRGLNSVKDKSILANGELLAENKDLIEVSVPITEKGERIGTVYLRYSKDGVNKTLASTASRLLEISFLALIAGAIVSLMFAYHITKPITKLTLGAEAIGRGELDTRISVRSAREIQLLASTFNNMVSKLKEGREALLEKEKMAKELEIARTIQATLLPAHLPHLLNFELDAYYHPASEVGGDYFDLIKIDDDRILIVVGDVAGKGVPGLVVMAMVRILVRSLARRKESPANLLRHLNVLLLKDMKKNMFVTLFCGVLDTKRNTLEFASAAHMPLLIYHCKEKIVRALGTRTKPLGIFPDEIFSAGLEARRVQLMPGDLFLQFTDGLSEMRNERDEEFGLDRLMRIVVDEAAGGARHLLASIKSQLDRFRGNVPQSDDLTIVSINMFPQGMTRAPEGKMESLDRVVFD